MSTVPALSRDYYPESINFVPGNTYVLARSFFDPLVVIFLYEVQTKGVQPITDYLRADRLAGKGFCVAYCAYLGLLNDTEPEDDDNLIYRQGEQQHVFKMNHVLNNFPLIEGDFVPGIYQGASDGGERHYEIKDELVLTEIYSCPIEIGFDYDEYKLVCAENEIKVVELETGSALHTSPRFPFNYFDLFCPVCDRQVYSSFPAKNKSNLCELTEVKCAHYMGKIEIENGEYTRESIEALKKVRLADYFRIEDYKLENKDLYLKIKGDWEKAVIYIPELDPAESYWGKSQPEDFQNHFIFLKEVNL